MRLEENLVQIHKVMILKPRILRNQELRLQVTKVPVNLAKMILKVSLVTIWRIQMVTWIHKIKTRIQMRWLSSQVNRK